jgi:putative addiction module component (TIGR02574 family)
MSKPTIDFSHLTPAERIQLAEDLWDSLPAEALPLTPAQTEELRRRREALRQDPGAGQDWQEALSEVERGG